MPNTKSVAGFPSKNAAILHLHAQGHSHEEIFKRLEGEASLAYIANCITRNREAVRISVEPSVYSRVSRAAVVRASTPRLLIERLLATLAQENLIDSILDDGITTPQPRFTGKPNARQ